MSRRLDPGSTLSPIQVSQPFSILMLEVPLLGAVPTGHFFLIVLHIVFFCIINCINVGLGAAIFSKMPPFITLITLSSGPIMIDLHSIIIFSGNVLMPSTQTKPLTQVLLICCCCYGSIQRFGIHS